MPPVLPTICPQERVEAKFIRSEYFSNRKYSIRVDLYEHDMARADIRYKGAMYLKGSSYICFDECKRESVYDLYDCLSFLQQSKTARRWFLRIMKPCYQRYLNESGDISPDIALEHENQLRAVIEDNITSVPIERLQINNADCFNRTLHLWTGEDWFMERQHPKQPLPPMYLHREKEELLGMIEEYATPLYNKLLTNDVEMIQGIDLVTNVREDKTSVNLLATIHYPKPPLYVMPSFDL